MTPEEQQLYNACKGGQLEIVTKFLENPEIDVNATFGELAETALSAAIQGKNEKIVVSLLKHPHINVNTPNALHTSPFWIACHLGEEKMISLLLSDERVDVNKPNGDQAITPFHNVCANQNEKIISLLLSNPRIDVNRPNKKGLSPFAHLCQLRNEKLLTLLASNLRVDINHSDNEGRTPLFNSVSGNDGNIVSFLLKQQRIDLNRPQMNGATPLFVASQLGHSQIVSTLLSSPATDPNKAMNGGYTPIFVACQNGHDHVVSVLLTSPRVDVNQVTNLGYSPLSVACQRGHEKVVEILMKHSSYELNPELIQSGESPLHLLRVYGQRDDAISLTKRRREEGITVQMDLKFVADNLDQTKKPHTILKAYAILLDLVQSSESRDLVIESKLLSRVQYAIPHMKRIYSIFSLSDFDLVRKSLIQSEFYTKLTNNLLSRSKNGLETCLSAYRSILSSGEDLRDHISKVIPNLLDTLSSMLNRPDLSEKSKLDICGIVLFLSGSYPSEKAKPVIKSLLPFYSHHAEGHSKDSHLQLLSLDCLMEASAIELNRTILLSFDMKDIVLPFAKDPTCSPHLVSCLIQALLTDSDECYEPTNILVLRGVISSLQKFSSSTELQEIETAKGFVADIGVMLLALRRLANNELDHPNLKNERIVSVLKDLFVKRRWNLLLTSIDSLNEFSNLVWVLSFDSHWKTEMIQEGFLPFLKACKVPQHESIKKAITGTIWNLEH